ncbi:MAG: hypothetical protein A2747_03560 [Candidatus Yonathbacteria bacterium RIFCSPHIGHO2_01_FULL_44_41]|uniref:Uncharacterized protein n=1 Tax=Candidatus Yonathbacteria bacterium RIFCSPHIGHO2_02_FULL_44_14 TaxID=1802724 RepID=A0A1G2S8E1_9BACT|nr:MAG: hypothetical protein A2747_03560 [Candidatus Yonathbacteria bacterium RIFCSPHIGHO2_01_FULL_44_41]OHA80858.1 MAG: hypothetical protein A3B06_03130 [Candidatus Yonathbacteria bacterium RIFCSPLOWO2_01_FULL_43_20]OHA81355.1 MAG: hypothetical protein A3D51_02145 [Candidatus Yonathbacteria bacterium RIFCSPHIGHO2_02_FULL_44_14]
MESFNNLNNYTKPPEPSFSNVEKATERGSELSSLSLKDKLLDSLEPVLNSIGISTIGGLRAETSKEITSRYTSLKDFSNEAGDFFKELIPQGIKPPERLGQGRDDFTTNALVQKEKNEFAPTLLKRKILRENLESFFEKSLFRKEKQPYETSLNESENNGVNKQEISRAMKQYGDKNILYEHIENQIFNSNTYRFTRASLIIQDTRSGMALDLDALLPSDFHFEPGVEDFDLKNYGGASMSTGKFFESPSKRMVGYGNITEKGKMLSLFHEIAHSWQDNYSSDSYKGKFTYKKLLTESYSLMQALEFASLKPHSSEIAEEISEIVEKLSDIGTELYIVDNQSSLSVTEPTQEAGVINLQHAFNSASIDQISNLEVPQEVKESLKVKKYYLIKNSKLEKAREEYIAEERDAWAHALRMMRFLRQKGLDIEPVLEKLSDIKEHIDPCLGSYQATLEMDIKLKPDDYRFSRLSQD